MIFIVTFRPRYEVDTHTEEIEAYNFANAEAKFLENEEEDYLRIVKIELLIDMKLTPKQYAEEKGITLQAVTKKLRDGKKLEGISKVEKFGRFYLLTKKKVTD